MIHNPKSQGTGNQAQMFGNTRSAEQTINKITWGLVGIFFLLTTIISASTNR